MKTAETKVPGKLYIAGEYAVVEAGHPAILITVNRFLKAKVTETKDKGTLFSKNYTAEPIIWFRDENKQFKIQRHNHSFSYLEKSIQIVEKYAVEQGKELTFFKLEIESQLDGMSGAKIGLGSSAAVTVAVIKVLLDFYSLPYTPKLLYKLSALAHIQLNSNGSFGDLAAVSYTGWLVYSKFDQEWLLKNMGDKKISQLVELDWPLLSIKQLTPPENLHLLIGWTGTPASTTDLVAAVSKTKNEDNISYKTFLSESKTTVKNMTTAFEEQNSSTILDSLTYNRSLLQQMGNNSNVLIETPMLYELCQIAEKYQAAAKTSGAGGGDCGIALFINKNIETNIIKEWENAGIVHLPYTIYTEKK